MRTRRDRAVLIAIVTLIALLLRVAYVHQTVVIDPLRADAGQYDRYATNLCEHGVFSLSTGDQPAADSLRGPGYPAVLAVLRALYGPHYHRLALYLQALLTALCVPLTYLLSRRFLPFWAAVASASLVALSPHLVSMSGYLLSESLLALVLLAALGTYLAATRRQTPEATAAAGVLFGGAALIHESTTLLLPVLIALELVARRRAAPPDERPRRRPGRPGIALCAFLLVVGAWSLRDAVSVSDPARSGARRAIATASHGAYPGFVHERPEYRYFPYREDPAQPAFGSSLSGFCSVLSQRVAERPLRYLSWYLLEKPYWLWSWNILQGAGDVYVYPVHRSLYLENAAADSTRALMYWLHPAIMLLLLCSTALAVWRTWSRAPVPFEVRCLAGTVIYFTAIGVIFAPWPRYSIPLRPEMYMVALWALHEIVSWVRARRLDDACRTESAIVTGTTIEPATEHDTEPAPESPAHAAR